VNQQYAAYSPTARWVIPDALSWIVGLTTAAAVADLPEPATGYDAVIVTAAVAFGLHRVISQLTPRPEPGTQPLAQLGWLVTTLLLSCAVVVALALHPAGALLNANAAGLGSLIAAALILTCRTFCHYLPAAGLPERALGATEPPCDLDSLLGRAAAPPLGDGLPCYLTDRRVLVIGAGGSIGSELCRQIAHYGPEELMLLDRDESALHATQLSLHGRALLDSPETILADIRDVVGLRQIIADRRPDIVFHAAALKHLPMLETHPGEAVKTNVWGTQAVLEACAAVERFVNISTDKAANPTSVLGLSKRITERLTAHADQRYPGTFLSVRFGNVLGSRGSALTTFQAQIRAGDPVTITHPDVSRYFMTVGEAVALVIQAAAIGHGGEALILDMGAPVRIVDVAQQMGHMMGRRVEIVYTGLRPGEKLHEDLLGDGEVDRRPIHPMISHVDVPPLDPAETQLLDPQASATVLGPALARLCVAHQLDQAPLQLTAPEPA